MNKNIPDILLKILSTTRPEKVVEIKIDRVMFHIEPMKSGGLRLTYSTAFMDIAKRQKAMRVQDLPEYLQKVSNLKMEITKLKIENRHLKSQLDVQLPICPKCKKEPCNELALMCHSCYLKETGYETSPDVKKGLENG